MKKGIWNKVVLIICMCAGSVQAQDIHFSQFYETSVLRNPSLVGIFTGDYKVGVTYREQWSSVSKPYQTGMISAETRIPVGGEVNDYLSFGLLSYYDKAGSISLQTLTVYPAVNYNKSLTDGDHPTFLSVGFTGGIIQRSFDPTKATFDEQYQNNRFDPANPTGEVLNDPSFTQWDMGAGASFNGVTGQNNNINYIFGLAGYHFSQPKYSFYSERSINIGVRWNVNAGLSVKVNETFSYQLHANYMKQSSYNEFIAGGLIAWNKPDPSAETPQFSLMGGAFYRFGDAIIPTVKIRYMDYSFGISYDVTASKLTQAANLRGGLELTVFKTGLFRDPKFQKSRTLCPHFY